MIAACDNEEKCAVVRPMGVLKTVDYKGEDLVKTVIKATEKKGVDFVVDTVGGQYFNMALKW